MTEKSTSTSTTTEEVTELDFESPKITNKAFNILALKYLKDKYGEDFQLFDKEKRVGDSTGVKDEWEKITSVKYQGFYCSIANTAHPFYVFMQSPYQHKLDGTRPYDSYVIARMSVRFENEIKELTKGLWDEFAVRAGFTYVNLAPNPSFFEMIDQDYSNDITVERFLNDNRLSTLIIIRIRGNHDRSIDRDAEREKIQIIFDEIMKKKYAGRCSITYLYPDTYDDLGNDDSFYDIGYYEDVQLSTDFHGRDGEGNVRLNNSITLENGDETFDFTMYEYPLNDYLSYVLTDNLLGYLDWADSLEYGNSCLEKEFDECFKAAFYNSDYELLDGPYSFAPKSYIIVDLNKIGLKPDDVEILLHYTVDTVILSPFRVLPDGKIIFNKKLSTLFAIAKRR
jgi:hypothetical protein